MNSWEQDVKLYGSEGALSLKQFADRLSANAGNQGQQGGQVYIPPEVYVQPTPHTPTTLREAILAHIAPNKVRNDVAHKVEEKEARKRLEHNINALIQVMKTGSYSAPHPMVAVIESRDERIKREANALSRRHSNGK